MSFPVRARPLRRSASQKQREHSFGSFGQRVTTSNCAGKGVPQAQRFSKGNLMCISPRLKLMIAPAGSTCGSTSELSVTSDGEAGERDRGDEGHDDAELAIGVDEERAKNADAVWLVRVATNATEDGDVEEDGSGNGNTTPVDPPLGEAPARPPSH